MAGVIDGHTHAFPPEIIADRAGYCGRVDWFRQLYENPRAKLTSETELLASMERTGVERAVVAGFPWADPGLCRAHNAWMAEICRKHPERLSFLAIVVPNDPDAARDAQAGFDAGAAASASSTRTLRASSSKSRPTPRASLKSVARRGSR